MDSSIKRLTYRTGMPSLFESKVENIAPAYFGAMISLPLTDIMNIKISQFHEAGLFSLETIRNHTENLWKHEEVGPQILTMQHLKAGFVVIFGLLIMSIAVFFAELATPLLHSIMKMFIMGYSVVKFTMINKIL
jgi:hypothetical protein